MMKNMLNESNSKAMKKETTSDNMNIINGGFGGNGYSNGGYSYEHPSMEEIMKFVTSTKEDILSEPAKTLKMILHFYKCDECRKIKDEMMQMESELELALSISK